MAPEMIEIVGGASNFTHVTRLLPPSLSPDRRHLHEFLVQNRLSVASMLLHRSELCLLQVLQLTALFTYPACLTTLLGQRCLDNRGSTVQCIASIHRKVSLSTYN